MKVLYITHCTDMSGANNSMVQLITELRDNYGIEPFVVYPKIYDTKLKNIDTVLKERGINSISHRLTCFQRSKIGLIYKIYFIIFSIWNVLYLAYILRNKKFDLVHSNSSVIDTGLYLAKLMSIPHVWHFREVAALSFNAKSILGEGYQKWVYSLSDKIVAISNNVKVEFNKLIPLDKTVVVQNGILPSVVKKYPNFDCTIFNICIVGRVEINKNQFEAVKAIQRLVESGTKCFVLHVVGNNNSDYARMINDYITSNHLEKYIVMHGVRYDIPDFLCDMHVGLMLSKHEAFGRVTVEYMMHKLCVIASNTSANPEIIHHHNNGLLYEIGSFSDLADKILYILQHHSEAELMAENGLNDAMNKYLSTRNSNEVYKVYSNILG